MGLSMFLPAHWSHIFVGCFIEEIAEEEKEPLARHARNGEKGGYPSEYPTCHRPPLDQQTFAPGANARANPIESAESASQHATAGRIAKDGAY